ncbi:hypothetical protein GY45DRAFT_1349800 [Cubamyces sp. BRFM 1775]|nr:hypothetical protein GY45DRAFT_1349800 [Cubamyces sp. BRFM 1775]
MTTRVIQTTDSRSVMDSITKYRQRNEDKGYIRQKNANLTKAIIGALLTRKANTAFHWVKGHNGHPENEATDELASTGANKPRADEIVLMVPWQLNLSGAKLCTLTQELAYKVFRNKKSASVSTRESIAAHIRQILSDVEDDCNIQITEANLWKSLKKSEISRKARQWMWMSIHDAYMVGLKWLRDSMSAELKERVECKICEHVTNV